MKKAVLALDLGGTNARFAAVLQDGNIIVRSFSKTPSDATGQQIVDFIVASFENVRAKLPAEIEAFAVSAAVPAIVDAETGVLTKLPNLRALEGVDLAEILEKKTGVRANVENDATAATIGEHWLGASKGVASVIGVTLGTGVGGGLILENKSLQGKDGTAGEVGHICVEPSGHPCGCGSRGCVEQYSSGTAIVRMARESGLDAGSALSIYEMAMDGDDRARQVFRTAGTYLGIALAGLVNVLNPEMIVIGGGVAGSWDLFIGSLRSEVRARTFREPGERVKVVGALLGDDAGILGASKVAFDRWG